MKYEPMQSPPIDPATYQQWLDGIARYDELAEMCRCHPETLRRAARKGRYREYSISERIKGLRRRDVLHVPKD